MQLHANSTGNASCHLGNGPFWHLFARKKNYTDNRPQASRKIRNAMQVLYNKLMNDAENEIKNTLKPSFCHPYLWVSVQNWTSVRGLYDTGADISSLSEKVFCHLKKLEGEPTPMFKLAGGQPLPVRGTYKFKIGISNKFLKQEFYVIPDICLNVAFL
jgi:hypothetical protein